MLGRMATMISSSAVCSIHGCDAMRSFVVVSQLMKSWNRGRNQRDPLFLKSRDFKWRATTCRMERVFKQTGPFMCAHDSGLTILSCFHHTSRRGKSAGGHYSFRLSSPKRSSGGITVAPLHMSEVESSLKNYSAKEPFTAVSSETFVKAIVYEAQRGFVNVVGKTKRFGDFLLEQVSTLAEGCQPGVSSETQTLIWSLSHDATLYDQLDANQRAALLNKVSQSLGFFSLQDLIAHDLAATDASEGLQQRAAVKGVQRGEKIEKQKVVRDVSKQRVPLRQVPGIKYGSSEPIKLPEQSLKLTATATSIVDPETCQTSVSVPRKGRKLDSDICERQEASKVEGELSEAVQIMSEKKELKRNKAKQAQKSGVQSPEKIENTEFTPAALSSSAAAAKVAAAATVENGFVTEAAEVPRTTAIDEKWGLDMPISSIKSISASMRARLEENGFNTIRLLLQHFPRMYQNFHLAGQRVEDGQNLSFVGVVLQSRGVPRGFSLGLVEVIVRSEVDEFSQEDPISTTEEGVGVRDNDKGQPGRTVFLHLKRFFKGSRYSNPWFLNAIAKKYPENAQVTVCGKVKAMAMRDHFEIREFNLEIWDGAEKEEQGLVSTPELLDGGKPYPVYSWKGNFQPRSIEFCIQRILPLLSAALDPIPRAFREKFKIQELHETYKGIHAPAQRQEAEVARHRLVFDEFFYLQLGLLLVRQELADKYRAGSGTPDPAAVWKGGVSEMDSWSPLTLKLVKSLPYTLTSSQIKAVGEVIWDLRRPMPMSRLLQGDVGCGKTVVAFLALLEVLNAGYQGALMAPTEFLAVQHYERITSWLEMLDESERPKVALLTGSTTLSKARAIRKSFESGEIALAVGTHSLISDSVRFSALKLAVIDEQHRFGVSQRGRLNSKGRDPAQMFGGESGEQSENSLSSGPPHILAMSATPIPRTLSLALHGDMSISQITELPPGRAGTDTYAIHGDKKGRQEAYKRVRAELENGGRVFVVFPVIEDSEGLPDVRSAETEFKNLELEFSEFKVGLVHGRMRPHDKDAAMERFKSGETQVLVSTTVIEVGIDIPEASMIVVEHAERYGMAQLHQLRGRVGRSERASSCILLGSRQSSLPRLQLLETSKDGFYLAEVDLQQRGPGDMLGKRQSGHLPEFNIARLDTDGPVLEQARCAAEELLTLDPKLKGLPRIRQELNMRRPPASLA